MSAYCSRRSPAPIYFIEHQGKRCKFFLEMDRDSNSRAAIVDLIRSGEANPVKILEIDESDGTVRDVTAEMIADAGAL
jgi:hypothetical protein